MPRTDKQVTEPLMVDCGATSHLVNDKGRFVSFDKSFRPDQHYIQLAVGHQTNQLVIAKGTAQYTILDDENLPQQVLLKTPY